MTDRAAAATGRHSRRGLLTQQQTENAAGRCAGPIANVIPIGPSRTCQWPVTRDRPWVFCWAPSRLGYCLPHARRALVRLCEGGELKHDPELSPWGA